MTDPTRSPVSSGRELRGAGWTFPDARCNVTYMPNPSTIRPLVRIGLLVACGAFGPISAAAQQTAPAGSEPQAAAVDAYNLPIGGLYRLSEETWVVMEPEPEAHTVPGVSNSVEHFDLIPFVPSGTVVRIARKSVSQNVIWYELRTPDAEQSHGWVSVEELVFQDLTPVE